jgi:hypothetical protein
MLLHVFANRSRGQLLLNIILCLCIAALFSLNLHESAGKSSLKFLTFSSDEKNINLNNLSILTGSQHTKRPELKNSGFKDISPRFPAASSSRGSLACNPWLFSHDSPGFNTVFYQQPAQISFLLDLPPPAVC